MENDDAASDEDTVFDVEKICDLNLNTETGAILYQVKWEGYGIEDATWEPDENVLDSKKHIRKYLRENIDVMKEMQRQRVKWFQSRGLRVAKENIFDRYHDRLVLNPKAELERNIVCASHASDGSSAKTSKSTGNAEKLFRPKTLSAETTSSLSQQEQPKAKAAVVPSDRYLNVDLDIFGAKLKPPKQTRVPIKHQSIVAPPSTTKADTSNSASKKVVDATTRVGVKKAHTADVPVMPKKRVDSIALDTGIGEKPVENQGQGTDWSLERLLSDDVSPCSSSGSAALAEIPAGDQHTSTMSQLPVESASHSAMDLDINDIEEDVDNDNNNNMLEIDVSPESEEIMPESSSPAPTTAVPRKKVKGQPFFMGKRTDSSGNLMPLPLAPAWNNGPSSSSTGVDNHDNEGVKIDDKFRVSRTNIIAKQLCNADQFELRSLRSVIDNLLITEPRRIREGSECDEKKALLNAHFHAAVRALDHQKCVAIVEGAIRAGVRIDAEQADDNGVTLLHYVAALKKGEGINNMLQYLLQQQANANARTHGGLTPIMCAVESRNLERVVFLLKYGMVDVNAIDVLNETALLKAIRCYHAENTNSEYKQILRKVSIALCTFGADANLPHPRTTLRLAQKCLSADDLCLQSLVKVEKTMKDSFRKKIKQVYKGNIEFLRGILPIHVFQAAPFFDEPYRLAFQRPATRSDTEDDTVQLLFVLQGFLQGGELTNLSSDVPISDIVLNSRSVKFLAKKSVSGFCGFEPTLNELRFHLIKSESVKNLADKDKGKLVILFQPWVVRKVVK